MATKQSWRTLCRSFTVPLESTTKNTELCKTNQLPDLTNVRREESHDSIAVEKLTQYLTWVSAIAIYKERRTVRLLLESKSLPLMKSDGDCLQFSK